MSGFFSPGTLEQVRAANDIVDVIGSYIPLKRAGANFTALCPFHKEKSPSFNVNPQKQIFHCFGCHKGGDVFGFVKEYENIPFPDAVRRLADRAKITLETENNPAQQQTRHLKESLLLTHEQLTQRWQQALANDAGGQIARDYLAGRGVSAEAIKLFRLGYAPDLWDDTVNWGKSKNFSAELLEQAGLVIAKEGGKPYDRFRGRLMFPICDEQARVIGFSGRILTGDQKTAKYVNSPETPIFTKGKVFFGMDKSKRAMLDAQSAIVCEGQLDLIACFMAGIQNIVAPQGTALTADHARILKRYVDEVVLCFDSDNAGQNAAVRSLDSLLASGLAVRVAVMPSPHDPDSFIKESGGEAFKELIAQAEGFFEYYLNRLCATNDVRNDRGRQAVLEAMAVAVHKTDNSVLIDKYAQKTALRLGVAPESVRVEFKKLSRLKSREAPPLAENEPPQQFETAAATSSNEPDIPPSAREQWLLKFLFLEESTAEWLHAHLETDWIPHALVREIVRLRLELHANDSWPGFNAFLDQCESPRLKQLIIEAALPGRSIPNIIQQVALTVFQMRNQYIERQMESLKQRLNGSEIDHESHQKLLELRQLKNSPLKPRSPSAEEPF